MKYKTYTTKPKPNNHKRKILGLNGLNHDELYVYYMVKRLSLTFIMNVYQISESSMKI